jgi:hypothetical protein
MTKYAMRHFEKTSTSHSKKNGLLYTSAALSYIGLPYFGPYSTTKMFEHRLASHIGEACRKSTVFDDLVDV